MLTSAATTAPARKLTALDLVHAIIEGLEVGEFSPGQRLVEAELSLHFGAGRQLVRDALQQLQARGVVAIAPNRGATVVRLTTQQGADTLNVTELLFGLVAESAARRISDGASSQRVAEAVAELESLPQPPPPREFVTARRRFFSALSATAGNDELSHLLRQVRVHVLRAQYGFLRLRAQHAGELLAVGKRVLAADPQTARTLARTHVSGLRETLINDTMGE